MEICTCINCTHFHEWDDGVADHTTNGTCDKLLDVKPHGVTHRHVNYDDFCSSADPNVTESDGELFNHCAHCGHRITERRPNGKSHCALSGKDIDTIDKTTPCRGYVNRSAF